MVHMTYLIHGATGAQGGPVVAALRKAGKNVTAAVRNPSNYEGDAVAVDFTSVASLEEAYRGVEGLFVHLPIGTAEQQLAHARTIVEAVTRAQPPRVVASTSGYRVNTAEAGEDAASVLVRGLMASGVSVAIVEPRLYLENLLLPTVSGPTREEGMLRYPIRDDYRVSWSSHLDIADVVVRLFDQPGVTGVVAVGALPGLLGDDLATGFGTYLDRDVSFEAQDPDDFGALITPLFGKAGADPVVASYHWRLTQSGEEIGKGDSAQQRLGIEPRSIEQWLRDIQA